MALNNGVITVDANSFESTIKSSTLPVIVIFLMEGAVASTRLLKRAGELDPTKFTLLKVDVNKSQDLVQRFSVRQVPYLIKFDPGGALIATGTVLSEIVAAI